MKRARITSKRVGTSDSSMILTMQKQRENGVSGTNKKGDKRKDSKTTETNDRLIGGNGGGAGISNRQTDERALLCELYSENAGHSSDSRTPKNTGRTKRQNHQAIRD